MARRFAKVSEETAAINEAAFFYPSDLINTKTTIYIYIYMSQKHQMLCRWFLQARSK